MKTNDETKDKIYNIINNRKNKEFIKLIDKMIQDKINAERYVSQLKLESMIAKTKKEINEFLKNSFIEYEIAYKTINKVIKKLNKRI